MDGVIAFIVVWPILAMWLYAEEIVNWLRARADRARR